MTTAEIGNAMQFLNDRSVRFPQKPKLVGDLIVFQMPDGLGMQFRGIHAPVVIRGALADKVLPWLMPLLDGTKDVGEILASCPSDVKAPEVAAVLKGLYVKGLIGAADAVSDLRPAGTVAPDGAMHRQLLFFGRQLGLTRANETASEVVEKLAAARIALLADGMLGVAACDILRRSGCANLEIFDLSDDGHVESALRGELECRAVAAGASGRQALGRHLLDVVPQSDLVIAVLGNASRSLFELVNETCLRYETDWLRACDDGSTIEVGPYVKPHDSPCYMCMIIREIAVVENAIEEELYQKALDEGAIAARIRGESVAMATLAASYLCTETTRVLTGIARPALSGAVIRFSFDGTIEQSRFMRVPRCPGCYRGTTVSAGRGRDRSVV